ncbi:DNA alkylation repair protein [Anaerolineales bacterium HSG25]|nr:DNA alkylation repair protein [Anaerolineales bacterium HSG25]
MKKEFANQLKPILVAYDPAEPHQTADSLRDFWLQFKPKSIEVIKAEQRSQQETVGIPIPVLKAIGKEISKAARKREDEFIPLARLLWDKYGREGRSVAVIPLGTMELANPEEIIPLLQILCRTCITWEDADRMAMNAFEPIVRKYPERWLSAVEPWLIDENKWVRRAGITVVGRLPMKHPAYINQCLTLTEQLLTDEEVDVKKAVSFAIRLTARGKIAPVRDFLTRHVPPKNPATTWVLCDVIRSMTKKFLPDFMSLLPLYEKWATDPALSSKDRRSIESAIKTMQKVQVN